MAVQVSAVAKSGATNSTTTLIPGIVPKSVEENTSTDNRMATLRSTNEDE